jgi:murein DD-endopeptidase MepM/ murein hydrolase activator NlpD
MRRPSCPRVIAFALLFAGPAAASARAADDSVVVEASDLDRRKDLIGKDVVVDDHVEFYVQRPGNEPDELQLKRTAITFLVPRRLRPTSTRMSSALVRGVLRRDDSRTVCDVSELRALPKDLERLERGVGSLPAKDSETRKAWVRWAERRAADFKDKALRDRARAVEADVLRIESEMKRLGVDAPAEWLAMALDARRREVAEPEPSALGHRAFRAQLARAQTVDELKALVREIESFFPKAATDRDSSRVNLGRWEATYNEDPPATYRSAAPSVRAALDRRLWVDAMQRWLESQGAADLQTALAAAEQAQTALPERADLPARIQEAAARRARQNLATLRLSEAKALADVFRDKLHQPDEALKLLRDWLKIQQDRLSSTDAEGALQLANYYEELLHDRVTCMELLRRAWKIDPSSKETAEAFRLRGFRKVQDEWIESAPERAAGDATDASRPSSGAKGLRNLTAEEVRLALGEPKYVSYISSKGQLIQQWIFVDTRSVRFVNIVRNPGELKARVVADYTLPPTVLKGGFSSSR